MRRVKALLPRLSRILIAILIANPSLSNAQVYITESYSDPEVHLLEKENIPYRVWNETPFRGVLVESNSFKEAVGMLNGAKKIEFSGLDALPKEQAEIGPKTDLVLLGEIGLIFLISGYLLGENSK